MTSVSPDSRRALLLDTASVEIVGLVTEYGPKAPKDPRTGSFAGSLAPLTFDERGGVPDECLEGYIRGSLPRCEARPYRDGWVLVSWWSPPRCRGYGGREGWLKRIQVW